jgi:hypothetical protein
VAFHHDLLEQAEHLVRREHQRPKQASLRRGISAAYYALFHLLVAEGASLLSPPRPPALRLLIQRAFNHGDMRTVCRDFVQADAAAGRGHISTTRAPLNFPLDPPLVQVLDAFVGLQEARHQADYDPTKTWSRLAAATHVATARSAFASWQAIRRTPNAAVFIAALLLQRQWGRSS